MDEANMGRTKSGKTCLARQMMKLLGKNGVECLILTKGGDPNQFLEDCLTPSKPKHPAPS